MGIELVELPYFAIGPPTLIAIPGFDQVCVCELLETTYCVESRGNLVGDRLVVDNAVAMRRADALFVKALGIQGKALCFVTNPLGSTKLKLDERFGLFSTADLRYRGFPAEC